MFSDTIADHSPCLLVIAGPNGSGKSTVTKTLPCPGIYVNADEIMKQSGCSALEAAQEAETIRRRLLHAHVDFTFETVLSTNRNLDLLRDAKNDGYRIMAVYMLTKDPAINILRVKERVKNGGHPVPANKIRSRYKKSLENLGALIRIADTTRIIDNSMDEPCLICEVNDGRAMIYKNEIWSTHEILSLLNKR